MDNHVVNPKEIFGRSPDLYDQARIGYKQEFVTEILSQMLNEMPLGEILDPPITLKQIKVVDIGAGTGQLGAMFLKAGCDVTFVEPSKRSVGFLSTHFDGNPHAHIVHGKGEDTHLPDHSADIIVMGDAAHWLKPAQAGAEFRRILKPHGKVAAFARFWSQDSAITQKAHDLINKQSLAYRDSPTQLMRDIKNLRKRHGHHLINEEENAWRGYSFVQKYSKKELVDYFKSCSFTSDWLQQDEADFIHKVIDPLWEYAEKHEHLTEDDKLKVAYEINALYGSPRKRIERVGHHSASVHSIAGPTAVNSKASNGRH